MDDVNEKGEALKSHSCPKEDASQIGLTPDTVLTISKDEGNTTVGLQITEGHEKAPETVSTTSKDEGNTTVGLKITEGHDKEKRVTEGEAHKVQAVVEVAVEGKDKEKAEEQINRESSGGGLKRKRIRSRRRNLKRKVVQKASEMVVENGNEGNVVAAANNGFSVDEKEFGIMDDVNEKGEALKSDSCPKEDASQIGLTPDTVLTISKDEGNTTVGLQITEGHEKAPETVSTTSKDEGNTTVGLKITEGHDKEKRVTEGEAHKVQAVVEVAVEGKDKEKAEEQINRESSGGGLKRKRIRPRRRNLKRKVVQKASEMVVENGNEGNVVAAANNGFSVDEKVDKEKVLSEDAVKGAVMKGEGEGKSDERKSMDKLGESSNGKGRKQRRIRRRKSAQKASEVIVSTRNEGNAAVKEALVKVETEEKKIVDKLGESSNGKGRKPKRNRQKKIAQKGSEMADGDGDKPESSSKKSALKRIESMGMVFMCSSKTKADCFRYKILGLPAGKKDQVEKIYKGMRLFLFDVDLRLMYGIFKAATEGGYNIEPKAFSSAFPSQVRFTVMEDCLPLAEEKFRNVIKENYYARNKFEGQLNAQQVKKLCKLFVHAKSGPIPKKSIKSHQSGNGERHGGRDTCKRQPREEERQPHPRLGREQRRYHDYDYCQPPVRYERAAHPSPVHPVARYLPPLSRDPAPVRSYGHETTYSYGRDPLLDHRSYHALDTGPRHYDEIVSRDQDRYHLYGREPPIYRDNVYPSVDQITEYRHLQAAALPPQYHLVSREYPPAAEPAEYHISGGLQARGYQDVGHVPEYLHSAASIPEYRSLQPRYGY